MEKRMLIAVIVLLFSGTALALSPMGSPRAGLTQGQFRAGAEYSYSDMDLDLEAVGSFDDVEIHFFGGNVGYGIQNNWEAFVRLGATDMEAQDWDGGTEFAYGFGTKVTFVEGDTVDWGGLFQMTWIEGDDSGLFLLDGVLVADPEVDGYEIQIAVGPTYKAENMRIYGGPFLHFIDADVDLTVVGIGDVSLDLEEDSEFGGFVGAEFDIAINTIASIDFMFTGDAWGIGAGKF
jgi:hypothetical protein